MKSSTNRHKAAILAEMRRREQNLKDAAKAKKEKELATSRRKEKRRAMREVKRIGELQQNILTHITEPAQKRDFKADIPVFDIRTYTDKEGLFVIGGYFGELLITLSAIIEALDNKDFSFSSELLNRYLSEVICDSDQENVCKLETSESMLEKCNPKADDA